VSFKFPNFYVLLKHFGSSGIAKSNFFEGIYTFRQSLLLKLVEVKKKRDTTQSNKRNNQN